MLTPSAGRARKGARRRGPAEAGARSTLDTAARTAAIRRSINAGRRQGRKAAGAAPIHFRPRHTGPATPGQVRSARAAAVCVSSIQPSFRYWGPTICGLGAAPDTPRGCGLSNFEEFSACSDAEAVFGGVVCVSVIVAPRGILLVVHMAHDRHRDHSDGCADDESRSYQLFHFTSIPSQLERIAPAARNIHAYLAEHLTSSQQCHTGYPWL